MKQLLHQFHDESCGSNIIKSSSTSSSTSCYFFVVGLQDRAFVGILERENHKNSNDESDDKRSNNTALCKNVIELQRPSASSTKERKPRLSKKEFDSKTSMTQAVASTEKGASSTQSSPAPVEEAKQQQKSTSPLDGGDDDAGGTGTDEKLDGDDEKQKEQQPRQQDETDPWQIQAVVGTIDHCFSEYNASSSEAAGKHTSVQKTTPAVVIVAVTYYNKTLAIYRLSMADLENQEPDMEASSTHNPKLVPPITVYHTPKRVGSLCFARVPSDSSNSNEDYNSTSSPHRTVIVTGDLAGDAFAYSLTRNDGSTSTTSAAPQPAADKESPDEPSQSSGSFCRLLLGHTASMLTAVECSPNGRILLTADRDEKIRVSAFPNTNDIHGYLLGHTAYISTMAVVSNDCSSSSSSNSNNRYHSISDDMSLVVSCGGDGALRVWDYEKCIELVSLDLTSSSLEQRHAAASAIPSKVAVLASPQQRQNHGDTESLLLLHVVVICDESKTMHVFEVSVPAAPPTATDATIRELVQIPLPAQPLAVSMLSSSQVLVLMRDPEYLQLVNIPHAASTGTTNNGFHAVCPLVQDVARSRRLQLPDTVLEKDKMGNIKLEKNTEKRGPAHEMPWNDARRKETDREQRRRARTSRSKRKRQKTSENGDINEPPVAHDNSESKV